MPLASRSGFARSAIEFVLFFVLLRYRQHERRFAPLALRRRIGRSVGIRRGRRSELGFRYPAGLQPRLHDHGFRVLARDFEAVEEARLMLAFAVLALGPAGQVVGGATSEIFDGLHAVLAELDEHRRGDTGNFLQLVGNAQFDTFVIQFSLLLIEIFLGAFLQFARRICIEGFDADTTRELQERAKEYTDKQEAELDNKRVE